MGSQLHQALRRLCSNTGWDYAVFWKVRHRARMMLTWEDAYYSNHEQHYPSRDKQFSDVVRNLCDGHYSHDSIELALAKMSYYVYSFGEGIVGQVAVTGKHLWTSADKLVTDSCSSSQYFDGWQTQFSAGIKTVAVVAVIPHGVVQLGSFNKIPEDMKLVNHIRDVFFELQDSLMGHIPIIRPCSMESSCLSDVSTSCSEARISDDCLHKLDRTLQDGTSIWPPMFPSFGKSGDRTCVVPQPRGFPRKTVEVINKHGTFECSTSGLVESVELLQSNSEYVLLDRQKRVHKKLVIDRKSDGGTSGCRDVGVSSEDDQTPSSPYLISNKNNLHNVALPADNPGVDISYFPSDFIDSRLCDNQKGVLCGPKSSNLQIPKHAEKNLEFQTENNHTDALKEFFRFAAGCELYEALGPAFQKQNTYSDWETENPETVIEMPVEGMDSSNLLTAKSDSEHLLEAVVANVCSSDSDVKSTKSFCKPNLLDPSSSDVHTIGSTGSIFDRTSLIEEDTLHCLNSSGTFGVGSSKGFSSASTSRCSEELEGPKGAAKINKKRPRPGENCRPRPRDRQLIQDRIKELRELVPNGSKCSIDSLLERTIKHLIFMQCITKHADKLDKCAESKLLDKETSVRGSSIYEQGSSWAMEVGSHMKVCPIKVETINMNGQMLVEMWSEDCSIFLEIAEVIRSLGLIILKGVTETHGEKTLISFVVEGQNNRSVPRMDILWSLMQMLQSKINI